MGGGVGRAQGGEATGPDVGGLLACSGIVSLRAVGKATAIWVIEAGTGPKSEVETAIGNPSS
jgi:hypothetical protein